MAKARHKAICVSHYVRASPCVGRLAATTGKSSRGAFGFVMPFPQQSAWPASGPSQRPRGPVRIFTNTQARGSVLRHSGAWSLVQAMLSWFLK